jgi:hypothetical protein
MAAFFAQMSFDHTGSQACRTPCVTNPLPAKKSTKVGAGRMMGSVEQVRRGLSKEEKAKAGCRGKEQEM